MEENITIVKSLIEDLQREEKLIGYDAEIEIQALENLMKQYRELEERIIQLTNLLCINDSDENYIEKTKIKEIRDKAEVMDYYCLSDVIEDLNKLLGDEE